MKPNQHPTKKMDLGVVPELESTLAAVRDVAKETGIPTLVHQTPEPHAPKATPATTEPTSEPTKKTRGPKPAPVKRFSVDLPLYAIEQIRQESFNNRCTKRKVILTILREGGLNIKDIDFAEPETEK